MPDDERRKMLQKMGNSDIVKWRNSEMGNGGMGDSRAP